MVGEGRPAVVGADLTAARELLAAVEELNGTVLVVRRAWVRALLRETAFILSRVGQNLATRPLTELYPDDDDEGA
ncbi:MAG: hypothetical protein O2816_05040 [Planctomycetota bacterium]|nr:hypothetical protein [Planctomycetota bacterium]